MTHELTLAGDEALIAATLALMTAYAGRDDGDGGRVQMAQRIVEQIAALRARPALGSAMRCVLAHVQDHWARLATPLARAFDADAAAPEGARPAPRLH